MGICPFNEIVYVWVDLLHISVNSDYLYQMSLGEKLGPRQYIDTCFDSMHRTWRVTKETKLKPIPNFPNQSSYSLHLTFKHKLPSWW